MTMHEDDCTEIAPESIVRDEDPRGGPMSNAQTYDMLAMGASFDRALHFHLTNRHFPPVGFMAPVCVEAIDACNEGDFDREIDTSGVGAEHRRYGFKVPAWVIAEAYHLEPFIADGGE